MKVDEVLFIERASGTYSFEIKYTIDSLESVEGQDQELFDSRNWPDNYWAE